MLGHAWHHCSGNQEHRTGQWNALASKSTGDSAVLMHVASSVTKRTFSCGQRPSSLRAPPPQPMRRIHSPNDTRTCSTSSRDGASLFSTPESRPEATVLPTFLSFSSIRFPSGTEIGLFQLIPGHFHLPRLPRHRNLLGPRPRCPLGRAAPSSSTTYSRRTVASLHGTGACGQNLCRQRRLRKVKAVGHVVCRLVPVGQRR